MHGNRYLKTKQNVLPTTGTRKRPSQWFEAPCFVWANKTILCPFHLRVKQQLEIELNNIKGVPLPERIIHLICLNCITGRRKVEWWVNFCASLTRSLTSQVLYIFWTKKPPSEFSAHWVGNFRSRFVSNPRHRVVWFGVACCSCLFHTVLYS